MTRRISVKLATPANDMIQEEIIKQVAGIAEHRHRTGVKRDTSVDPRCRADL